MELPYIVTLSKALTYPEAIICLTYIPVQEFSITVRLTPLSDSVMLSKSRNYP